VCFNILFIVVFLFCSFVFYFVHSLICIFCVLFLLLYIVVGFLFLYQFTETLPLGGNTIAINKYIKFLIPTKDKVYIFKVMFSLTIATQEKG